MKYMFHNAGSPPPLSLPPHLRVNITSDNLVTDLIDIVVALARAPAQLD